MKKVIIEFEFETDRITDSDVINYLDELIGNDSSAFETFNERFWFYTTVMSEGD